MLQKNADYLQDINGINFLLSVYQVKLFITDHKVFPQIHRKLQITYYVSLSATEYSIASSNCNEYQYDYMITHNECDYQIFKYMNTVLNIVQVE